MNSSRSGSPMLEQQEMQSVEVRPRSYYLHRIMVARPGQTIRWSFFTRKKNIAFGLLYHQPRFSVSASALDQQRDGGISPSPTLSEGSLSRQRMATNPTTWSRGNGATGKGELRDQLWSSEYVEMVAVQKFQSAENVVEGTFAAPVAGDYVLCFDNTYSIGTSKILYFRVGVDDGEPGWKNEHVLQQGWLRKKKRKRMQGWARRWVVIDGMGILRYYENKFMKPCRGAVDLITSTVTKVPHRRIFIVDSGWDLFHFQAETESEYSVWIGRIAELRRQPALQAELKDQDAIAAGLEESRLLLEQLRVLAEHEDNGKVAHLPHLERSYQALKRVYMLLCQKNRQVLSDDISIDEYYDAYETSDFNEPVSTMQESSPPSLEEPSALVLERGVGRTALPAVAVAPTISIASILRKSIGRDLSSVSLPIALNEPLSALQRMAEDLEYAELLDQAAKQPNPLERMLLVAAFAISGYAASVHRPDRKPFNPLLGETYELQERSFCFIAEKVSHRPLVLAGHAQSESNWEFWLQQHTRGKFWGRSIELCPEGLLNVRFSDTGDHFVWNKVTTTVHNVFGSSRWIEHCGDMIIINQRTGVQMTVSFKPSDAGFFSYAPSANIVTGRIGDHVLSGRWDSYLYRSTKGHESEMTIIWSANPLPPGSHDYYNFTSFALRLNEPVDNVAPTDCRHRPDQRLLEYGRLDDAEAEKNRLEARQRQLRQEVEESSQKQTPCWFELQSNGRYAFNKKYWNSKKQQDWSMCPRLW